MKKNILVLGLCAGLFLAGCEEKQVKQEMPPLPVTAMKVVKGDQPISLSFNGKSVSELDIVLKAKVAGSIENQFFTPGDSIKEGDKLYQIDEAKYKALYDSANGNFVAAQALAKSASAEFARVKTLKAKNAVSQKDYDNALASTNSADANVKAALGAMQNAKIDWEYSTIKAPFSGVIGDSLLDKGSYVDKGEELVRLSKLDPIYVKFGISDVVKLGLDNNLANGEWKRLEPKVTMKLNGKDYVGKLVFIDSTINQDTATVEAKAVFENKDLAIKPGIYTKVDVSGFYQKDAFKLPQSAVSQDPKGSYVYVVKDGAIEKKYVKIVSSLVDESKSQAEFNYIIKTGINDGDIIALDNFKKINIGSKVQIINDPNNPAAALQAAKKPENSENSDNSENSNAEQNASKK